MAKRDLLPPIQSIKHVDESQTRIAKMGDWEWGKYLHDAGVGAVGGAAAGAVVGGIGAAPGAAMGAAGSLIGDAGEAAWYGLKSNVDKASWQAGDVQTKLDEISSLVAKVNPKLAEQIQIIGIDYKGWIDHQIQRKQGIDVSKNLFNPDAKFQNDGQTASTQTPTSATSAPTNYSEPNINPNQFDSTSQSLMTASKRTKFVRLAENDPNSSANELDPNSDEYTNENWKSFWGKNLYNLSTAKPAIDVQNATRGALGIGEHEAGSIGAGLAPAWDQSLLKNDGILNGIKGNWKSIGGNVGGLGLGLVAGIGTDIALNWVDSLKGVQGEINERISDIQNMIPEINQLSNNDSSAKNAGDMILKYLQTLQAALSQPPAPTSATPTPVTSKVYSKFVRLAFQNEDIQNISVKPTDNEDYCEECFEPHTNESPISYSADHDKRLCSNCAGEMSHTLWRDTFEKMPIDSKVQTLSSQF